MYLLTCPLTPGQQRGLLDARTGRPALSSQADSDGPKRCAGFACRNHSGLWFP